MGVNIVIEGTGKYSGLPRPGERKTVQLTPRIEGWLNRGLVVEVSRSTFPDHDYEPAGEETSRDEAEGGYSDTWQPSPPSVNASRVVWAKFLSDLFPPVKFPEDATRGELQHIYQEVVGGS